MRRATVIGLRAAVASTGERLLTTLVLSQRLLDSCRHEAYSNRRFPPSTSGASAAGNAPLSIEAYAPILSFLVVDGQNVVRSTACGLVGETFDGGGGDEDTGTNGVPQRESVLARRCRHGASGLAF